MCQNFLVMDTVCESGQNKRRREADPRLMFADLMMHVCECESGWWFVCLCGLAIHCRLVQGVTRPPPHCSCDRLQQTPQNLSAEGCHLLEFGKNDSVVVVLSSRLPVWLYAPSLRKNNQCENHKNDGVHTLSDHTSHSYPSQRVMSIKKILIIMSGCKKISTEINILRCVVVTRSGPPTLYLPHITRDSQWLPALTPNL